MRREISSPRGSRLSVGRQAPKRFGDGVVTLRLPEAADIDRLASYGADEGLLEGLWVGCPPEDIDIKAWASHCVGQWLAGWTDEGSVDGPALIADEQEPFVGIAFLMPWAKDVVELAYGVLPSARGRGIASRITRLAAEWALGDGEFARVELRISESHAASQRVAEKTGFRFEERFATFVIGTGQTHVDLLYVRTRQ